MIENESFWYAAITRAKHEIMIRDFLRKINITCYLGTYIECKRYAHYRLKKIEKPVISNLIFIYSTKETIISILDEYGLKFSLIRNKSQLPVVIPQKQMEDFICMVDTMHQQINTDFSTFLPGDQVRVLEGPLAGIEGELIKINNRHHVMLRLQGVVTISVKVPKRILEKIT